MDWSPQQELALSAVAAWIKDPSRQVFKLFGWAGTGKTTLAIHLAQHVRSVAFAAYTGKAAFVMKSKGCASATTLHRLIYRPAGEEGPDYTPTFQVCQSSAARYVDLIIVDECSMINEELALDLLSFGTKVLVLGDPAQLPPIEGGSEGYFNRGAPDVLLTEIHRQALDNPILHLATLARQGKPIALGSYGTSRVVADADQHLEPHDQLLVFRNDTRRDFNRKIRRERGYRQPLPELGERLICLQNNSRYGVLNGEQFKVTTGSSASTRRFATRLGISSLEYEVALDENEEVHAWIHPFMGNLVPRMEFARKQANVELDWAYAVTVHKGQGSEWPHVMVYDECYTKDRNRWLYTAITRAQERLTLVIP